MNWLSSMTSGTFATSSLYSPSVGTEYGLNFPGSASSLIGAGVDASSLFSGGFVGSTLGAGYGGQYAGGAFGGALEGQYGQPQCPQGFGHHHHHHHHQQQNLGLNDYAGCSGAQQTPGGCWAPQSQGGTLTQNGSGQPIDYTTSGGYKIDVNGSTVTVTDPSGKNTVQEWGDPHENVNGAQVDNWSGTARTLVLGDGTRLTMNANASNQPIQSTSIYDGSQAYQIDNNSNTVNSVSSNPYQNAMTASQQVAGDTAYFGQDFTGNEVFNNLFTQNADYSITNNFNQLAQLTQPWA